MGRHKILNPTPTTTMHISENTYNFLKEYRKGKEPSHATLDRLIADFKLTTQEWEERSRKQEKVIELYHNRIKEMEQTRLVPIT